MSSPPVNDVHRQQGLVTRAARMNLLDQRASLVWFTGLSGSGKTTVANLVAVELHRRALLTYILDGDNLRNGLCKDLGFSAEDRSENIRRVAEVAGLMIDAGLIVLAAFISPFRDDRDKIRRSFAPEEFMEVHVDAPLDVLEQRDSKGLYARARTGEISCFTGVTSPYEPPTAPELRLEMSSLLPQAAAAQVIERLTDLGRLEPQS